MNTKVIPGEECVHEHHLVVMNMHLKVRKYRKNHQGLHKVQPRIKVWKLKKQEARKAYLEKLLFFCVAYSILSVAYYPVRVGNVLGSEHIYGVGSHYLPPPVVFILGQAEFEHTTSGVRVQCLNH